MNTLLTLLWATSILCIKGSVLPFDIPVDSDHINHLHQRLEETTWPTLLSDVPDKDWTYGVPVATLQELSQYLQNDYNFSEQVAKLNDFSHFMARIDNQDIHFIHQRSSHTDAVPLMFVHGWPGSFMECTKIIPLLTEPQLFGGDPAHAFHVVCPSIPGYGYSPAPTHTAFDQYECAKLFNTLMVDELHYSKYYLQGGDWGSVVTSFMASLPDSPKHVIALHLNMVPAFPPLFKGLWSLGKLAISMILPWWFYTPFERQGLLNMPYKMAMETGYFHEQSTRPQTLAFGLSDSPVGLLAWIVEKFHAWGDCRDDDVYTRFTKDELLTNFMIYWTTNSAASSVRFYHEFFGSHNPEGRQSSVERLLQLDVKVPTAFAIFPKEIFVPVEFFAKEYYSSIVHWHHMSSGGHFAALEEPQLLVQDLWSLRASLSAAESRDPKKKEF